MNDCNEWKTDKHHKCTNIAQLQTTQIMTAAVAVVGTLEGFTNFKAAWFLLDSEYPISQKVLTDLVCGSNP
jgi:hypothetical protein